MPLIVVLIIFWSSDCLRCDPYEFLQNVSLVHFTCLHYPETLPCPSGTHFSMLASCFPISDLQSAICPRSPGLWMGPGLQWRRLQHRVCSLQLGANPSGPFRFVKWGRVFSNELLMLAAVEIQYTILSHQQMEFKKSLYKVISIEGN